MKLFLSIGTKGVGWLLVKRARFAGDPVAVKWAGENTHVFARGTDNFLYHMWTVPPPDFWNPEGWMRLGRRFPFAGDPIAIAIGENIEIFARGTDNFLYHMWTVPPPDFWNPEGWMRLGRRFPFAGDPIAIAIGENIEIFARGTDNFLYHMWTVPPPDFWNPEGWMRLGQQFPFAGDPIAIAIGENIEIFARGTDNFLYHMWTVPPPDFWNPEGWMRLGQQFPFAGDPVAVKWAGDNIQIFAFDIQRQQIARRQIIVNRLHHMWTVPPPDFWNPGGWSAVGQTLPLAGNPVAIPWTGGNIQIFTRLAPPGLISPTTLSYIYHIWTEPHPYRWR